MTKKRCGAKTAAGLLIVAIIVICAVTACCEEGFRYDPHGKRDPLVPLLGKDKPVVLKLENITSVEEVRLEGIADGASGRIAILNGELVKENDKFGEVIIKNIAERSVTITIEGKAFVVALPEEGGLKE